MIEEGRGLQLPPKSVPYDADRSPVPFTHLFDGLSTIARKVWGAMLLASIASATPALAQTMQGTVVGVHDGDTLTLLLADKTTLKVRLADVDAPELGQAFGNNAKRALDQLCGGRQATIQKTANDGYGRTVARVDCGSGDASAAMVRLGMAWAYRKYLTRTSLLDVEADAQRARTGLWASDAIPPWEWRGPKRSQTTAAATAPVMQPERQLQTSSISLHGFFESPEHKSIQQQLEERGANGTDIGVSLGGVASGIDAGGGSRGVPGPIQTGPRGGRFYVSGSGGKVYLPKGK